MYHHREDEMGATEREHDCRYYNIRVAFKSSTTLRSSLTRVKDKLLIGTKPNVVYQILFLKTIRNLESRMKEHKEVCKRSGVNKSAAAKHAWDQRHHGTTLKSWTVQAGNWSSGLKKPCIYSKIITLCVNRDVGLEIPGCWLLTLSMSFVFITESILLLVSLWH